MMYHVKVMYILQYIYQCKYIKKTCKLFTYFYGLVQNFIY